MKSNKPLALVLGGIALFSSLIAGCSNTPSPSPQEFLGFVQSEFLFTVNNDATQGVVTVPLTDFTLGTLGSPVSSVVTDGQGNNTAAQSMAFTSNGTFVFVANGTNVINQFLNNPLTLLDSNGTFTDTLGTPVFGKFSLVVDPTNSFLIAANQNGATSDVRIFPISATGTLGAPTILVNSAALQNVTPNAIGVGTLGTQSLLGIALNLGGVGGNNVEVAPITVNLNGSLSIGAIQSASAGNSAATVAATDVAFTASGGNTFANAVTNGGAAGSVVASVPVTVAGGAVTLGAAQSIVIDNVGVSVGGDSKGHVFTTNADVVSNVQSVSEDATGALAITGSGATSTAAATSAFALDPTGNLNFLYVSNSAGDANNITLFSVVNGVVSATGASESVGNNVVELHTLLNLAPN